MDDIFKSIEEYSPNNKRKILIALDDMMLICLAIKRLSR